MDITMVIKRDGTLAKFDKNKIVVAIEKAMKFGSGILNMDKANEIANDIYNLYKGKKVSIHAIELQVYGMLVAKGEHETARAYEAYRAVQEFKRNKNTTDDSIMGLLDSNNEEVQKENSNKNATIASTQRDLIAGEVSKDIARRKLIPADVVQAHDEGAIHYHDLDYAIQSIFNCCLVDVDDMLQNGTVINDKLVEKPKSFETACTVVTQIMAQVASNQYGGQSTTIRHLAPFLRISYEKHLEHYKKFVGEEQAKELAIARRNQELKNGVQTIRYQLSTLQTTNGQSPFCSIYLEIVEGSEFEEEEALICEEMIRQRLEGMKNYKGQEIGESFPKLVYVLDDHNCLEGGKYDYITELSARCNVKRLVPDYQSAKIMRINYEGNNFPPIKK